MSDLRDFHVAVWCPEHKRFETDTQRISELTTHYLEDHPEVVESVFGKESPQCKS